MLLSRPSQCLHRQLRRHSVNDPLHMHMNPESKWCPGRSSSRLRMPEVKETFDLFTFQKRWSYLFKVWTSIPKTLAPHAIERVQPEFVSVVAGSILIEVGSYFRATEKHQVRLPSRWLQAKPVVPCGGYDVIYTSKNPFYTGSKCINPEFLGVGIRSSTQLTNRR